MPFHRLDLSHQRISAFNGLEVLSGLNFVFVDVAYNALQNFDHFGRHPSLVEIDLRYNKIESFFGLTRQDSLKIIHLVGNPVCAHPLYRIMILLAVGYGVKTIDNRLVSASELSLARQLGAHAALAVSCGWMLDTVPRSSAEYRAIATLFFQNYLEHHPGLPDGTCTLSEVLTRPATNLPALECCKSSTTCPLSSSQQYEREMMKMLRMEQLDPSSGLIYASCVEFDAGITVSINLIPQKSFLSVFRFSGMFLSVLDFLTRKTIISFDISTITITHKLEKSLVLQSSCGIVVKANFHSSQVFGACYATFLSRLSNDFLKENRNASLPLTEDKIRSITVQSGQMDTSERAEIESTNLDSKNSPTTAKPSQKKVVGKRVTPLTKKEGKKEAPNRSKIVGVASPKKNSGSGSPETCSSSPNASVLVEEILRIQDPPLVHSGKAFRSSGCSTGSGEYMDEENGPSGARTEDQDFQNKKNSRLPTPVSLPSSSRIAVSISRSDGGVRTPPPMAKKRRNTMLSSKFKEFMVDSDEDSESE